MENRGRKRSEIEDQPPAAEKRACSEPGPSTSSAADCDLDSSASASGSGRSEVDSDRDSGDGSGDSDGMDDSHYRTRSFRESQRRIAGENPSVFRSILSSLDAGASPPGQGAAPALEKLCNVLSMSTEDTLTGFSFESFVPRLVALANEGGNPDAMLLAIRAIVYLCDRSRRAVVYLVRYEAVPMLCARLMAMEYVDVAELCLIALKKISKDHPVVCLNAGAILAVLNYIDFFSSGVRRDAVSTVANICKKLPSDCSAHIIVAIPILCNLLRYEDRELVQTVALSLKRIVMCSSSSSEMLDELCKHGAIHQSAQLLALHGRMTLSQPTYTDLIGMLARLASGSLAAVRTLFELNMSSTLKDILASTDLSHGTPHSHVGNIDPNQLHEVLKLLNELLPPLAGVGEHAQELASDKEKILKDQPELLRQFGVDILPVLIQVVSSGANLTVCYGCLSVINKLVYFSSAEMLLYLLNNANISSFLASVLAQYDHHHVLVSALRIADIVMQKLLETLPDTFVKEGVLYAVDALLMSETSSRSVLQKSRNIHQSSGQTANGCLCYTFDMGLSSEKEPCKIEKDTVYTLAKHLKATYFGGEILNSEIGLTETIQKLRTFCALLSNDVKESSQNDCCADEEYFSHILEQIMGELNGANPMSTFEFIESGVVRSLAQYLSNGKYLKEKADCLLPSNFCVLLKRFETFVKISLTAVHLQCEDTCLILLVRRLQSALSSLEHFPVIASHAPKSGDVYASIPGCCTKHPCLRVRFVREEGESVLSDHSLGVLTVDSFSSFDDIERFLWPKVGTNRVEESVDSKGNDVTDDLNTVPNVLGRNYKEMKSFQDSDMQDTMKQGVNYIAEVNADMKTRNLVNVHKLYSSEYTPSRLIFYLKGKELDRSLALYQAVLQQVNEDDVTVGPKFWSDVYEVKYRRAIEQNQSDSQKSDGYEVSSPCCREPGSLWKKLSFVSSMMTAELPCNLDRSNPTYDILFLLKFLEGLNRFTFQIMSHERLDAFAEGRIDDFDDLKVRIPAVPQVEFVSSRLSDKLTQQMQDPLAVSVAGMPPWCSQLMDACPFLFSFEARRMYFRMTVFGSSQSHPHPSQQLTGDYTNGTNNRQSFSDGLHRDKFHVHRSHILDSAVQMMNLHAHTQSVLEVVFHDEVGTGLGPTMEFYTLVSHEFQKADLGMWRDGHSSLVEDAKHVIAPLGLFPRPWSAASCSSNGVQFTEVIDKFLLLGQVVAKAIKDRRVMDLSFSKAFYKFILEQELDIYDIHSFDPELGRTLLEFQALVERKRTMESVSGKNTTPISVLHFRGTRIEDLCLDFTLPGYNDYKLGSTPEYKMVNSLNLEEYISLIVDATLKSGISKQVEAFKTGFNQVFPLKALQIFTEDEIERLLCGEQETWVYGELLDHIIFDHGYTASSPPISNGLPLNSTSLNAHLMLISINNELLEIIQEFGCDERRAFLQFVTGAPRLPPGGLAALNPKLTIVRKQWSTWPDSDLPSVMTCQNYLKLPPYSSKEIMRERLLYAITEGQGSFHLS